MSEVAIAEPNVGLEDGFHDIPMHEYLALPYWSSSLIGGWKTRTPKYMKWLRDGGRDREETASSSLGSLTHTAVLEPDLLDVLYVCEPEPDPDVFLTSAGKPSSNPRATKGFKDAVAELAASGRSVVTHAAMRAAKEMRDAVHCHSTAAALLQAEGAIEVSGVVTDPETGVRCRVRPDKLVDALGANCNLKTSENPNADAWVHDLYRFGYFRDFAFYERMLRALGFDHRRAIAITVEKTGPLDDRVAVHQIDEGAMDAGHQLVDKYLQQIATCEESGDWPGHPPDIRSISLPHYAWARVDEEIAA